ncbi:hypothetical protein PR048_022499 [Dryococelus australis]|uniref:Uncharacterized protein n=1 Tax=Dryococelus australis TaxID=614101 RepID=A0ABQ9H191_9NEOP|nr:hypothetical protein PR048_022499 [Dryococelus australis]
MRAIEVSMGQRRNERAGEMGDPRENSPTMIRPGIEPGSSRWEASRLTAQPPWPQALPKFYFHLASPQELIGERRSAILVAGGGWSSQYPPQFHLCILNYSVVPLYYGTRSTAYKISQQYGGTLLVIQQLNVNVTCDRPTVRGTSAVLRNQPITGLGRISWPTSARVHEHQKRVSSALPGEALPPPLGRLGVVGVCVTSAPPCWRHALQSAQTERCDYSSLAPPGIDCSPERPRINHHTWPYQPPANPLPTAEGSNTPPEEISTRLSRLCAGAERALAAARVEQGSIPPGVANVVDITVCWLAKMVSYTAPAETAPRRVSFRPPPSEQTRDRDSRESARATRRRWALTQLTSLSAGPPWHPKHVVIVPDDAASRRVSPGISHSITSLIPLLLRTSPRFTLIGSQDVESVEELSPDRDVWPITTGKQHVCPRTLEYSLRVKSSREKQVTPRGSVELKKFYKECRDRKSLGTVGTEDRKENLSRIFQSYEVLRPSLNTRPGVEHALLQPERALPQRDLVAGYATSPVVVVAVSILYTKSRTGWLVPIAFSIFWMNIYCHRQLRKIGLQQQEAYR